MTAANVLERPAQESGPRGPRVAFSGDDDEFRSLVTRGALLELVTFGFYRFWLATNIRRHLWTHTLARGDGRAHAAIISIEAASIDPTGAPLLSSGEWQALKAICK